jgi:hypothetical protein
MMMSERQQQLLTDEDVDKFIDRYAQYDDNVERRNDFGVPKKSGKKNNNTRRSSFGKKKNKKPTIRRPSINRSKKKIKKKFMTSKDRLRLDKKRREQTDARLKSLLIQEEKEKQLACVSGVAECNQLSIALDTCVRYETIEDNGIVVGVRARARRGISAKKRAMLSTKQLMTPDEFARERARLKRMAEREIRRRRFRRKSEPNLLTLGNLLAATKNNNANSGTRRRKSGGGVLKMTTTTTTNLDAISIQKALDSVLRDVTKASSQIETQTREFEKSGWVFGFNVGIMNKKGVRRRRGRNTSNN